MQIGIPSICKICDTPQRYQTRGIIHCKVCDSTGIMENFALAYWFQPGEVPKAKLNIEKARQYQENITYNRQARVERILAWNRMNALI